MTFALLVGIALIAVASTTSSEETFSLEGDGTELLGLSSFTSLDRAGHLSYLFAHRHAVKKADAAKLKLADEKCKEDRAVAFQHCGAKFCGCQGSSAGQCDMLELAEFLETPAAMLSQAGKTCDMAAVHDECKLVVGDAFHSCRNSFLASKPVDTKALLMAENTDDFINLAAQYTTDRHSVMNFAAFLKQDLLAVANTTANTTAPAPNGPEPDAEERAVEHYAATAKHFAQVKGVEYKVRYDLHEAKISGEPIKHYMPLYESIKKCRDLKRNTYMQCGKLMCNYVSTCGSKVQMAQCAREAAQDAAEKKTKEIMFKHRKAIALALFKHKQEVKAKAPELKAKANTKEKVWKRGAPERDSKETHKKKVEKETAEIRAKAAAQVAKWLPNHDGEEYVCSGLKDDCKWVKKKAAKKTARRLLEAASDRTDVTMADSIEEDYILNAKSMEEIITKKQKAAEDKARREEKYMKSVAKLEKSPACKASANAAFGKCHELTHTAYDICINVYDKASKMYANYTASHPTIDFAQIRATIRAEKRSRQLKKVVALAPPEQTLYQEQTDEFESELAMGQDKILKEESDDELFHSDEIVPE